MFPLHFHYEDVSRQDPLLKPNQANVMEVPGSFEIRVIPKPSDFRINKGKLAMEIPRGQKFIQTQRGSTRKSFRSNQWSEKEGKGYVSDLARQSTLRGHGMSNISVRISKYRKTPSNSEWKRSFANFPRNWKIISRSSSIFEGSM